MIKGNIYVPVIVRRNRIRNPRGFSIRIDDADRRHVHERALVQHDIVLHGVQANDEVGHEGPALRQVAVEALDGLVVLVEHLHGHTRKNDLAVRDRPGRPLGEEVAGARQPRGLRHDLRLAGPRADEQDEPAAVRHLLDDARGPAQVRRRLLQRDDVDALPDAVDVPRVRRVPERRVVAHVRLARHQQLQRHVLRPRRVQEHVRRPVRLFYSGADPADLVLQLLRHAVVLDGGVGCDGLLPARGSSGICGEDRRGLRFGIGRLERRFCEVGYACWRGLRAKNTETGLVEWCQCLAG